MKKLLLVLVLAANAIAIPQIVNYQGQLTSPTETPLDTTVAMTFNIWPTPAGGVSAWTEAHPAVVVTNGLFSVQLGSITALPDLFGVNRWLGITVGNNTEMTPREQLVSVVHAYRVGTVDGASGGTITGNMNIVGKANIGSGNDNSGDFAFVAGQNDTAGGDYSTICGGFGNEANGFASTIGGGSNNGTAIGNYITIGGGFTNFADGGAATICGGGVNSATSDYATVGGGYFNSAYGVESTVGGGFSNDAGGELATVAGGGRNESNGSAATVGGGYLNFALGEYATVGGGFSNHASDTGTTVAGGQSNEANGNYATVGGGYLNFANGNYAIVVGGRNCQAAGISSIAGGDSVLVFGDHSVGFGQKITCNSDSAFVFSDGTEPFVTGAHRTASFLTTGGFRIWTAAPVANNIGTRLTAGGTSWVALSDSTTKENRRDARGSDVLQKIADLPIDRWNYKHQDENTEHIGPMAQDFWKAFRLGSDSLGIETIDADGVLFAAVKELAKQNEAQATEIAELKQLLHQMIQLGHK